jgi:Asp-tRNA(Asn)/Glu-tRNA(Gln) amidotransferase B subunit
MSSFDDFDSVIARIKESVAFIEADATRTLRRFTCVECERLDEAIECLHTYCFYGSVVMAVSAVEARIMEIVRREDKTLYESHFSKATFGQLIQLFDENHYKDTKFKKLKNKMAAKHKPLVALLNQYRVFSAHPKTEQISAQVAEAILKLCFTFMIDVTASPYKKNDLKCDGDIASNLIAKESVR